MCQLGAKEDMDWDTVSLCSNMVREIWDNAIEKPRSEGIFNESET